MSLEKKKEIKTKTEKNYSVKCEDSVRQANASIGNFFKRGGKIEKSIGQLHPNRDLLLWLVDRISTT